MLVRKIKLMTGMAVIAASAMPLGVAAQENATQNHKTKHHHYILKDMGTFGGVRSDVSADISGNILNQAGSVVGGADTPTLTPEPGCFNPFNQPDCLISHAFVWSDDHLTDLGTLPEGNFSFAAAINRHGKIAGVSEISQHDPATGFPEYHAVLWENDKILDLGTLGGPSSIAFGLNDRGQVVGPALNNIPDPFSILGTVGGTSPTQTRGFLWEHGVMHDLGTLGGPDTWAVGVNNRGQVAGTSYTSDIVDPTTGTPPVGTFLWENGRMKDLGNLGGHDSIFGTVSGLNNRGEVTGSMVLPGDQFAHAFLWDGEKLADLGSIGGNGTFSIANWINDAGEVVGFSGLSGVQPFHAFLWKEGVMTDLGSADGDPCSDAFNINSRDQVVGESQPSDGMGFCVVPFTHALLWENGEHGVDLNSLIPPGSGVQLFVGTNINERGEIVALGNPPGCTNDDTCRHAYVLIPCDEDHPNFEGCDYNLAEDTAAESKAEALTHAPSTTANAHATPNGLKAAVPALFARRHHVPNLRSPNN